MDKKQTVLFNKIVIEGGLSVQQVADTMRRNSYDEAEGLGFTNVCIEDDIVYAQGLFRTPSYIQSYNKENGLFEQKVVDVYTELEITLDIGQGFIYSATSSTKFNKAKILLRKCFSGKIIFRNIDISPIKLWERIKHDAHHPLVTDLSIKRYIYKEGVIGRLSVHIEETSIGEELIAKYSDSINKITMLVVGDSGEKFILSVPSQNSFSIKCAEEYMERVINQLKMYI